MVNTMMPFKGKESKKEEAKEMKAAGSKKMYMKMEKAEGKKSTSFKPCPGCKMPAKCKAAGKCMAKK